MSAHGIFELPPAVNEPILSYAPGTRERGELKQALKDLSGRQIEIPIVIGGREIRTGRTADAVMPESRLKPGEGEPVICADARVVTKNTAIATTTAIPRPMRMCSPPRARQPTTST